MKRIDEKIDQFLNESVITDTIQVLNAQKQDAIKNHAKYDWDDLGDIKDNFDNRIKAVDILGDIELMLHTMSKTHGSDLELQKSLLFCKDKIGKICKELIK